jgi:hypothetical protein
VVLCEGHKVGKLVFVYPPHHHTVHLVYTYTHTHTHLIHTKTHTLTHTYILYKQTYIHTYMCIQEKWGQQPTGSQSYTHRHENTNKDLDRQTNRQTDTHLCRDEGGLGEGDETSSFLYARHHPV